VQQALERQPELQALSWNPVVSAGQRAEFEAAASAAGKTNFQFRETDGNGGFVIARERPFYVPVYFIEPSAPNAAAVGYDLASDPMRLSSIEQARDSGKPVATAPIHLAQGPDNQAGFLVVLPVYGRAPPKTEAARREQLTGFAVAVFRVNDLVAEFFQALKRRGIDASLYDESRAAQLLYSNTREPVKAPPTIHLEVAGRKWAMPFEPTSEFIAFTRSHLQSWLVFVGGLSFTLLSTAYLYDSWRRATELAALNAALQQEVMVRQRAEAAAADANQAKSDFLASMSHEIRTPLNAILGYTQLMQRDPGLPAGLRDWVFGITAGGRHLLGLINEILDLSKIEARRMELKAVDFDIVTLAGELAATFRPLCAEKKIAFRLDLASRAPQVVRGDEGKLRQVLINLLGNAIKFTNSGEVCLRLSRATTGRWLFEVFDTGLGIPDSEHADIFKPFHQGSGARHQGGTGLGLTIAQRQVELLGGELKLQSERGVGSRFYFELPFAAPVGDAAPSTWRVRRLAGDCTVRALIVDDNRENREVLGGALSTVGCEVSFAQNGAEAMAAARSRRFDVVFLDLLLPESHGEEVARDILADSVCGAPKIIAHTASALPRHHENARAAGCVDFINKPFDCEKLYECLERHLNVRMEREPGESEPSGAAALEPVALPDGLCARLTVAAELHSTTALKTCLAELSMLGPAADRLAAEIRLLMRSYDMDAIQRLLTTYVSRTENAETDSRPHAN
jgi:signal transduction histidine kinase/CheY-like chemotaxis protein